MARSRTAQAVKRVLHDEKRSLEDIASAAPEIRIMDTSAILHDPRFLLKLSPNVVVIIPESVANELDHHKDQGTDTTRAASKEYLRLRGKLRDKGKAKLVHIPGVGTKTEYHGYATVVEFPYRIIEREDARLFSEKGVAPNIEMDQHIIETAYYVQRMIQERKAETASQRKERIGDKKKGDLIDLFTGKRIEPDNEPVNPNTIVKLLTKDRGMLERASDKGIEHADFYEGDRISEDEISDDELYKGRRVFENTDQAHHVIEERDRMRRAYQEKTYDQLGFRFQLSPSDLEAIGITQLQTNKLYSISQQQIDDRKKKGKIVVPEIYLLKSDAGCKQVTDSDITDITSEGMIEAVDTLPESSINNVNFSDELPKDLHLESGRLYKVASARKGEVVLKYNSGGLFDIIKKAVLEDQTKSAAIAQQYVRQKRAFEKEHRPDSDDTSQEGKFTISPTELGFTPSPNEFVFYKVSGDTSLDLPSDARKQILLKYNAKKGLLEELLPVNHRVSGVTPQSLEQFMAMDLLLDSQIPLVILGGKAGTGKTFLTLAAGLAQLKVNAEKIDGNDSAASQTIKSLTSKIQKHRDTILYNDYKIQTKYKSETQRRALFRTIYGEKQSIPQTDFAAFCVALDFLTDRAPTYGKFPETEREYNGYQRSMNAPYHAAKAHHEKIVEYFRAIEEAEIEKHENEKEALEKKLPKPLKAYQQGRIGRYKKIIVTRPVVPAGKDIGFMPGSLEDKMRNWLEGINHNLDALAEISNDQSVKYDNLRANRCLEVVSIAQLRGTSYDNSLIIIDEAQNLTPHEVKMIITRAGKGTKVVLLGDPEQRDNPYLDRRSCGLVYAAERFRASHKYGHLCGYVELTKGERSELATAGSELL